MKKLGYCVAMVAGLSVGAVNASDYSVDIVGGELVKNIKDPVFKHTVRLLVRSVISDSPENPQELWGRKLSSRCSATVVSSNKLVSAAHCFPEKMYTMYQGAPIVLDMDFDSLDVRVFTNYEVGGDYTGYRVSSVVKHPGFDDLWYRVLDPSDLWDPSVKINDIAIVEIEESLPANKEPASFLTGDVNHDQEYVLAGYGSSGSKNQLEKPHLRKVSVPYIKHLANLADMYVGVGDQEDPGKIESPMGGCFGDSGGPAFVVGENGQYSLAGVIVRGPNRDSGGCHAGLTVLTDVTEYEDFLIENL